MPMLVRKATTDDFPRLIELGRAMREESIIPFPEVDVRHTLQMFEGGLDNPDFFTCFVAEDEQVVGFLTAYVSQFFFSPESLAAHDIFYVSPESRKSRAAVLLVKAFVEWAEERAPAVLIRLDTGLQPERVDRFYKRMGFEHMGGIYMQRF